MALCCETHGRARGTTTINDYTATKRKSPDIIRGFKLRDWHKFTWNKFGQPQVVRWGKYTDAFHQWPTIDNHTDRLIKKNPWWLLIKGFDLEAWQWPTLARGNPVLPSALSSFTSEFGMVSGGTHSLWLPGKPLPPKAAVKSVESQRLSLTSFIDFHFLLFTALIRQAVKKKRKLRNLR